MRVYEHRYHLHNAKLFVFIHPHIKVLTVLDGKSLFIAAHTHTQRKERKRTQQ